MAIHEIICIIALIGVVVGGIMLLTVIKVMLYEMAHPELVWDNEKNDYVKIPH